jgi:hypothetical protein
VTPRPKEAAAQPSQVDDVADQIQRVATRIGKKIEEQSGLAFAGAQVDVGEPYCSVALDLIHIQ